ncbi:unnamed protein product, partial [Cyprideis torosa]
MALAELENQLGGSLFDRHGRSLLLNARGRYLLPLAKDITAQVVNVEQIMTERNDKLSGHIEVIATLSLGNYILPYLIGAFQRIHPRVHINMLVYNTQYAERMLADGAMDIGFVEGSISHEDLVSMSWFEDELVVVAAPSDPISHNKVFDVKKHCAQAKWVM